MTFDEARQQFESDVGGLVADELDIASYFYSRGRRAALEDAAIYFDGRAPAEEWNGMEIADWLRERAKEG